MTKLPAKESVGGIGRGTQLLSKAVRAEERDSGLSSIQGAASPYQPDIEVQGSRRVSKTGDSFPLHRNPEVAQHFGVNAYVVYYWIERNLIQARRLNQRMPYWITLNGSDEQRLQDRVRNSTKLQKRRVSPNATAVGAL